MFPCIQCLWQALQRAVALFPPPNLHRTNRTDRGLAELAPRCGSFLAIGRCKHSKQFVYNPRAAVIVPFRRLPTHSTVSVIFSTLRVGRPYRDLRSRYGVPPPNPHSRCRALSLAKPSTFRSPSALASPQFGASFLTRRTDRPRTLPANFTLSHIQSLSSFFSRAPSSRAHNRSPRASSHAACYTSERRKRFLPCSSHSAARTSLQGGLAPQRVSLSFFPSAARPLHSEGFQHQRGVGLSPPHHVADHIQPHNQAQYGQQCSQPTVRHRATTPSLLLSATSQPCRRSDVPQASTHKHFAALAPSRTIQPSRRTPRRLPLCPRQPPTTHPLLKLARFAHK